MNIFKNWFNSFLLILSYMGVVFSLCGGLVYSVIFICNANLLGFVLSGFISVFLASIFKAINDNLPI